MSNATEGAVTRREAEHTTLSQPARRTRRRAMARYVAQKINGGMSEAEAKRLAAAYFVVSVVLVRNACREFLSTQAVVKPTKKSKAASKGK